MDCAEEVSLLRRELSQRSGIRDLSFDVMQARMDVAFDNSQIQAAQIESAVRGLGMRCEPWESVAATTASFWQRNGRSMLTVVSGLCTVVGLVWIGTTSGDWVGSLLAHQHADSHDHVVIPWTLKLVLLAGIVAGSSSSLPKAWASLRAYRPDMNALVLFSVAGAIILGEWGEAATLSFLFALAGILETWSLGRARDAVTRLLKIAPREASLLHAHHDHFHEKRVSVDVLEPGMVIRIKPGERIACDGLIERGVSHVDQALITGESEPIEKTPGSTVYAGTLNIEGTLDVRTTHRAADTVLARMTRMVGDSQKRRAPSEQLVERFTRHYTPIVFALSFLVMVAPPLLAGGDWSHWFYQGMVVLLIACPCALVISTPVSIAAALTAAARHGVLVKGGAYLEEAARLKAIAFDKTGVLTQGRPEVHRLIPCNGVPEATILRNLANLEAASEHPLATAIVAFAEQHGAHAVAPAEFRALQGLGAEATLEGQRFWVGNHRLLREKGLHDDQVEAALESLGATHTIVACGVGQTVWALLSIADPARLEAPGVVSTLREMGLRHLVMLTGDNAATARSIGATVGITEVQAELLPAEKATAVGGLKRTYGNVAMVGDGVNDALALNEASVGINFGEGQADVAAETADIVLLQSDLRRLPFLIRHARYTLRIIKQNLAIALGLKLAFLILAMSGQATLWMAVAADMGATFLVTFNGLRLLGSRPR